MTINDHFGLDIGSDSIKLVQLESTGQSFKLVALGYIKRPEEGETVASSDQLPLIEAIKNLVKAARPVGRRVVLGLPESQVYTRIITLPVMDEVELASAIKFQMEQYVPLPADQIIEQHTIISKPAPNATGEQNQMQVLLVACPTILVGRYMQMANQAGLEVAGLDTEMLSALRAIIRTCDSKIVLLVNIGSNGSDLALVRHGELFATRSLPSGSIAFTRAIAGDLKVDLPQAEGYKKSMGMDEKQLSGALHAALKPVVDQLVTEIKRILGACADDGGEEAVKQVLVGGGGALMPGLVSYLAAALNTEVGLANPFADITKSTDQEKYIGENGALFTTAVGLAQKEL